MPQLKDGEILTPLDGICDAEIKGEGIIDMLSYEEDGEIKTGFQGEYIGITLSFSDERGGEYAEIQLSNRLSSLRPLRGEDIINLKTGEVSPPEGTIEFPMKSTELEEKIILCSELLLEILREKIKRGGIYGGEKSYQLFKNK